MRIALEVPTKLGEITIGQYQAFTLAVERGQDIEQAVLEHYCKLPKEHLDTIKKADAERIAQKVNALFAQDVTHIKRFVLNNVTYGFVPNLDTISFAEFKDIESSQYSAEGLHILVGTLYREIIKEQNTKYHVRPYKPDFAHNEKMKNASIEVAIGTKVFFYNIGKDLLSYTRKCLATAQAEEQKKPTTTLKNGAGWQQLIASLGATLQSWTSLTIENTKRY